MDFRTEMVQKKNGSEQHPPIDYIDGLLMLLRNLLKFLQGISRLETLFNSDFELITHRFQIVVMALQQKS